MRYIGHIGKELKNESVAMFSQNIDASGAEFELFSQEKATSPLWKSRFFYCFYAFKSDSPGLCSFGTSGKLGTFEKYSPD